MNRVLQLGTIGLLAIGCSEEAPRGDGCGTSSDNTILFDPPLTEVGDYTFVVEMGSGTGECDATMTADGTEGASCTMPRWSVLLKVEGVANGDVIEPVPPKEILGLLVGTAAETEVSVTVSLDEVELFEGTLLLEPDTVDDSCGEVERLVATAEMPD